MPIMYWLCRCGHTNVGTDRRCKSCNGLREHTERKDPNIPSWLVAEPKK